MIRHIYCSYVIARELSITIGIHHGSWKQTLILLKFVSVSAGGFHPSLNQSVAIICFTASFCKIKTCGKN